MSLHLSQYHIVGNLKSRLNYASAITLVQLCLWRRPSIHVFFCYGSYLMVCEANNEFSSVMAATKWFVKQTMSFLLLWQLLNGL